MSHHLNGAILPLVQRARPLGYQLDVERSTLRRRYVTALRRAGLKQLRIHDLRHTFGTLAVQAFALTDVKAYMGHADIQTTMRYVHHVHQHDAADRLSRLAGPPLGARRVHRGQGASGPRRREPHKSRGFRPSEPERELRVLGHHVR